MATEHAGKGLPEIKPRIIWIDTDSIQKAKLVYFWGFDTFFMSVIGFSLCPALRKALGFLFVDNVFWTSLHNVNSHGNRQKWWHPHPNIELIYLGFSHKCAMLMWLFPNWKQPPPPILLPAEPFPFWKELPPQPFPKWLTKRKPRGAGLRGEDWEWWRINILGHSQCLARLLQGLRRLHRWPKRCLKCGLRI